MSLTKQSLLAASSAAVATIGRFALLAILARKLPQSDFGQLAYIIWLVDISFMALALGLNAAASRYLAEYHNQREQRLAFLRYWCLAVFAVSLFVVIVIVLAAYQADLGLSQLTIFLIGLWALANNFWAMLTAALSGYQRFDLLLKAHLLSVMIILPLVVYIPSNSLDLSVVISILAFVTLMQCLFARVVVLDILAGFRPNKVEVKFDFKNIRAYSLNMWAVGLLSALVWSRGEMPVIRSIESESALAFYAAALLISSGAVQGVMLWVSGVAPRLTLKMSQGNVSEAVNISRDFADIQLVVAAFFAILINLFANFIVSLIYGSSYLPVAKLLTILSVGLIALSASAQNHLIQISSNGHFNRNVLLAGVVILYLLAMGLVPSLGLSGAATARVIAMWGIFLATCAYGRYLWGKHSFSYKNTAIVFCAVFLSNANHEALAFDLLNDMLLLVASVGLLLLTTDRNGVLLIKRVAKYCSQTK
jgi:O-antigen/teichoic acid export membrane protein